MIGLLQRVSEASVRVGNELVASIGPGLLVLVAAEPDDGAPEVQRLAERLVSYRVFADDGGKMNLDVRQIEGSVLLVPQFTLAADTRKGNRPSFSHAAAPEHGRAMFERLVRATAALWPRVASGRFGAHMAVALVNDGPVTLWLRIPPPSAANGAAPQA